MVAFTIVWGNVDVAAAAANVGRILEATGRTDIPIALGATGPIAPAPELRVAKDKFVARSNWRTTGWSPFAVGLHRTAATPPAFPFETWKVSAAWMGPGEAMEMLVFLLLLVGGLVWAFRKNVLSWS